MLNLIINNLNILETKTIADLFVSGSDCNALLGESFMGVVNDIYLWIRIIVPIMVVLLTTLDMAKAVVAQKEDEMVVARTRTIKRIIIGLAIFFIPDILDIMLLAVGVATGTCGIGG